MRVVARRRAGTAIARRAEVGARLQRPRWQLGSLRIAGVQREFGDARRNVTTSQCQNPLPVGASGSKQVTAKLLVPAGAPDQARCGD